MAYKSSNWLTVRTGAKPALLLVSSVGLHLTRRAVTKAAAVRMGRPWKALHREGWRVVRVSVHEVAP